MTRQSHADSVRGSLTVNQAKHRQRCEELTEHRGGGCAGNDQNQLDVCCNHTLLTSQIGCSVAGDSSAASSGSGRGKSRSRFMRCSMSLSLGRLIHSALPSGYGIILLSILRSSSDWPKRSTIVGFLPPSSANGGG